MSSGVPSPGYLVWRLSLRWQNQLSRALAPLGITPAQYSVLASLVGLSQGGASPSQREVADVTGLEPMYVSKLVRALRGAGLLERGTNPTNARAARLAPTERGIEIVAAARREVVRLTEERMEPLGGIDSPRAREFLTSLRALLQRADVAQRGGPVTPPGNRTHPGEDSQ